MHTYDGKTLAQVLGAELIRLQCYEGIDSAQALYEWDYARQLLYARALQAGEVREHVSELYGPEFLIVPDPRVHDPTRTRGSLAIRRQFAASSPSSADGTGVAAGAGPRARGRGGSALV